MTARSTLHTHRSEFDEICLRNLIDSPDRGDDFIFHFDDMLIDCTRHLAVDRTLELLRTLATECGVQKRRDAMFAGEPINTTEQRSVLHVALRNQSDRPILADGRDVMPDVREQLDRMRNFAAKVHDGTWRGWTDRPVQAVVNIGIGGSDLGPVMAVEAMRPFHAPGITSRFVSNVDPSHLHDALKGLDPETTLFIISSKTFGTQETLSNAAAARRWMVDALGTQDAVANHFVAVSTNASRVEAFGIDTDNMFTFWDWVGGRYSMWSSIGLSIVLAVGFDRFADMLAGAFDMDEHFRTAPIDKNIPMTLGLLDCWYRDFWSCASRVSLPYDQHLSRLPAYLQQLEMESNGKHVQLDGKPVPDGTAMIVWGEPGTNGQHSFHQMLHQGTTVVPADFFIARRPVEDIDDGRHAMLVANCVAQAEVFARGRTLSEVETAMRDAGADDGEIQRLAPHRVMVGQRPSTTFAYDQLDPRTLGRLIALHEHRVFVQGAVWNIDSFDQWGVEMGKEVASTLLAGTSGDEPPSGDATSQRIVSHLRQRKSD
jgi:glucose-6-phosphate isomerase